MAKHARKCLHWSAKPMPAASWRSYHFGGLVCSLWTKQPPKCLGIKSGIPHLNFTTPPIISTFQVRNPPPPNPSFPCEHMNESFHIWVSHVTHEGAIPWIIAYLRISHVAYKWVMSHMNESCHIWMSHVTYEWVMSHMNESCHIWMSHVTYEWIMSHMKARFNG